MASHRTEACLTFEWMPLYSSTQLYASRCLEHQLTHLLIWGDICRNLIFSCNYKYLNLNTGLYSTVHWVSCLIRPWEHNMPTAKCSQIPNVYGKKWNGKKEIYFYLISHSMGVCVSCVLSVCERTSVYCEANYFLPLFVLSHVQVHVFKLTVTAWNGGTRV